MAPTGHINLIHVADAAKIILTIEDRRIYNELLLVSDGNPPLRKEFYQFIADQLDIGQIDWSVAADPEPRRRADKKISNRKLIELTNYKFSYPSYQIGVRNSMDESN